MYILIKHGVYQHGVFWIGRNLKVAKKKADKAASLDSDDYHKWIVHKYSALKGIEVFTEDAIHQAIYTGVRIEGS